MLIAVTALVIALSFELSLVQSLAPPECIAAYNATFNNETTASCPDASIALFLGTATDDQRMMVCSPGQQCNTMIENVIDVCGNKIESPTRLTQDLLCAPAMNGTNCLATFLTAAESGGLDIFDQLGDYCTGSCSPSCRQGLMQLNDTLGCCLVEVIRAFTDSGEASSLIASLFANQYPELCGLGMFTACDGSVIPPDPCSTASINFFGGNDECSRSAQQLFSGDDDALFSLFDGDCPARFSAYASACSELFGDSSKEITQLADRIASLSQATSSEGVRCTEVISLFYSEDYQYANVSCTADYFLGQCSDDCRNALTDIVGQYGCCLNAALTFLTGFSDEVDDQIELAIITREVYTLCGIQSPGFCAGSDPPTYTAAAERCVSTRNSFIADDTCLDYYYTLGERNSAAEVNNAAFAICGSQRCKNRLSSYTDYLTTCRIESVLDDDDDDDEDDDDDDDDDDDEEEEEENTELAYLTGNTTCIVDSSNTSCYSSIFFNQQYALVSAAFDDTLFGVCVSSLFGSCSNDCTEVLTAAYNEIGCCLGEYGRALLGNDILIAVSNGCGVPSLSDRCTEISAIQDVESGANTQTGLGIMAISLLGVIASMFS